MNLKKSRRRSLRIQNYPASSVTAENNYAGELIGDPDSEVYGSRLLLDSETYHDQNWQTSNDLIQEVVASEYPTCSRFLDGAVQTATSATSISASGQHVFYTSERYYSDQQQELGRTPAVPFECRKACDTWNKGTYQSEHSPACVSDTVAACGSKEKLHGHQISPLLNLITPTLILDSGRLFPIRDELQQTCSSNTENILSVNTGLPVLPHSDSVNTTTIPKNSANITSGQKLFSNSSVTVGYGSPYKYQISTSACCSVSISNCVSAVCQSNQGFLSAQFYMPSSLHVVDGSSVLGVEQESKTLDTCNSDGHSIENDSVSTHRYDGETSGCKLNSVVGNTNVPVDAADISYTTALHQHCGCHTEQKRSTALRNDVSKYQAAKIKKQRRRSAFGSEFKLATCARQSSPPNTNSDKPGMFQEPGFPAQKQCIQNSLLVSSSQSQSVTCTINDGKLITLASNGQLHNINTEALQLGNVRADVEEAGLDTGSCDQESPSGQQLQCPQPKSKRKKRMSADASVMGPSTLMNSIQDYQFGGCVVENSVFTKRRSSLRLLRRHSHKFAFSDSDTVSTETETSESKKNKTQTGRSESESPVPSGKGSEPLTQLHSDVCFDFEKTAETTISPQLENLYRNKNYKKPADKSWETIFECPFKGRMTSKQKLRRYLSFEDTIPMSKLKRRWKKATLNGWDAGGKIPKQMSDHEVKQKLQKLDEEISNA